MNTTGFRSVRLLSALILSIALILSCAVFGSNAAWAVTSADKQAEADAIQSDIDALQTQLNEARAEYDRAQQAHEAATQAAEAEKKKADEARKRTLELQERLGSRVSTMYKENGSITFMNVLLGANSFSEFLNSWAAIETITRQDAKLVEEAREAREAAEKAEAEFNRQKELAAEELRAAEAAKTEVENTQAVLQEQLGRINEEIAELQAQEEEQRIAAEEARRREAAAQAAANSYGGGGYSGGGSSAVDASGWAHPCPGLSMVSSTFGWRDWDSSFHKGIDYAAPQGTPTYAALGGTVTIAGYSSSAGNWVVISHGNGLVTKYMHHSQLAVSAGQYVEAGQLIGYVGSTGYSSGPHLHFQIEIYGTAVDPQLYV